MKTKRKKRGRVSKKDPAAAGKLAREATVLVQPVCEAAGLELVMAEFRREPSGRILRLYIDRPDGVTMDDCAHISRQVTDLLDVSMENIGPYNLEVSSPGPRRPLVKKSDYQRFAGHMARIRLHEPLDGQEKFKGILSVADAETVKLETETGSVSFDFSQIAKARLAES